MTALEIKTYLMEDSSRNMLVLTKEKERSFYTNNEIKKSMSIQEYFNIPGVTLHVICVDNVQGCFIGSTKLKFK